MRRTGSITPLLIVATAALVLLPTIAAVALVTATVAAIRHRTKRR